MKFTKGHCSCCQSTNIAIKGQIIVCLDCNDWEWFEDAINSCWNAECGN